MSSGGIEGAAFRIANARIRSKRRFLAAARILNALLGRKRKNVFVVKIEIAGN